MPSRTGGWSAKQVIAARRSATMFKWAVSQDIVETDPADGLGSYSLGQPRDRVLSEDEISRLWRWLDDSRNISTGVAAILKLQLCLGARVGEIAGMRAGEFARGRQRDDCSGPCRRRRAKNKKSPRHAHTGAGGRDPLGLVTRKCCFRPNPAEPHTSGSVGNQLRERAERLPIDRFKTHDLAAPWRR